MSGPQSGPCETSSRSLGAVLAAWWGDWIRSAAGASDLGRCSEGDLERVAQDVGMTANELRRLPRHKKNGTDLLFRRMAVLDLRCEEVSAVDRATYLDLERVCIVCDCKGRCKRDLARCPNDACWEGYCPNVATLKMLDAMPWSSRRE